MHILIYCLCVYYLVIKTSTQLTPLMHFHFCLHVFSLFSLVVCFVVREQSLRLPFTALLCFSNHGNFLSFTLSSVAPPPRDAEDTPRKCPQMMDRQEAGSVGVVGLESLSKDETITKSPSPRPHQPSRRPLWQEDDDLPPM